MDRQASRSERLGCDARIALKKKESVHVRVGCSLPCLERARFFSCVLERPREFPVGCPQADALGPAEWNAAVGDTNGHARKLEHSRITNRRVVDRRALLGFFYGLWRQLTVARALLRECTTACSPSCGHSLKRHAQKVRGSDPARTKGNEYALRRDECCCRPSCACTKATRSDGRAEAERQLFSFKLARA